MDGYLKEIKGTEGGTEGGKEGKGGGSSQYDHRDALEARKKHCTKKGEREGMREGGREGGRGKKRTTHLPRRM